MYNLERNNNCGLNLFEEFDNFFANVLEKDMKTNIVDNENNYVITSELAGVKKEDIKINVEDDTLEISVTKKREKEDNKKYLLKEISESSYKRSFYLEDMDTNNISAKMENGVLSITIEKLKEVKPVQKKIVIE